jgi:hypothetical protein
MIQRWPIVLVVLYCLVPLVSSGCGGQPRRVVPPDIDADGAARSAFGQYDTDRNGLLSPAELAGCPSVLKAIERYDRSRDGNVSLDELAVRIRQWQEHGVGLVSVTCTVALDGKPLENATVTFVPEDFLSGKLSPASGQTDREGVAAISIAATDLPADQQDLSGLRCGLYKVEVTHPQRKIPARYNTASTLGQEVAADMALEEVIFALQSK